MTDSIMEQYEKGAVRTEYTPQQIDETYKYLDSLKFSNRKQYNKYKKQGKKFSDTLMKRLK